MSQLSGLSPEPEWPSEGQIHLVDSESEDEQINHRKRKLDPEPVDGTKSDIADNEDFIGFNFGSLDEESQQEEEKEEEEEVEETRPHKLYPWILNRDHSKQREIADWLSLEIKDFVAYISPSKEEIAIRNGCIERLKNAIERFWKDSHVYVFGSYATDLYLPHLDIDMVVKTDDEDSQNLKDNRQQLYKLASHLKSKKVVHDVQVIANARVPIIKLVESASLIHVDISFERVNGIEAANIIMDWEKETKGLRELVLIVKQFLASRRLNDVHLGGLGGYSIICLVYSFLKMHPRLSTNSMDALENLGVLLVEFFELYGKNFAYDDVIISPVCQENNGQPGFLNKAYYPDLQGRNLFQLSIQDPSDAHNNISSSSYNLRDIKRAFAGAFDLLVNKVYELELKLYKERLNQSILGNIIKYKGEKRHFIDERHLIKNIARIDNQVFHYKNERIVKKQPKAPKKSVKKVKEPVFVEEESEDDTRASIIEQSPKPSIDNLMGLDNSEDELEVKEIRKRRKLQQDLAEEELEEKTRVKRNYWAGKGRVEIIGKTES